jgi:hypothetical protein
MTSLYDELAAKLEADPSLTRRGGPRVDLSLLLFNARESLCELWHAAEDEISAAEATGRERSERLRAAVDQLRPIFGDRPGT